MAELSTWETLPVAGAVRPGGAPRTQTGGWRTGEKPAADVSLCVNCLLCWLYCPRLRGHARRDVHGFDLDYCKGCGICADVCPVTRSRWCANEGHPAPHRRRGRRARDAPGRSRRRSGLPDHAADADHPDLREARRGREGEHGDRQRGVGALRHERCDRRRARRRTHDDRDLVPGARPDGRGRLHRRLDARADRHGARQPRALRADQHPLRPLGLDAHPGLRRRPALRRERPGGVRPDGDGAADRRGSARPAAGARLPRRLHDHAFRRAGLAPSGRRRRPASSARTASRTPCSIRPPTTQGPFAMPDYYFELRRQQAAALEAALDVLDEVAPTSSGCRGGGSARSRRTGSRMRRARSSRSAPRPGRSRTSSTSCATSTSPSAS